MLSDARESAEPGQVAANMNRNTLRKMAHDMDALTYGAA